MAIVQHEDIVDPYIHEPKGASAASLDTVYVADGAGSGTWKVLDHDNIDMTDLVSEIQADIADGTITLDGKYFLTVSIPDVSTASSVLVPIVIDSTVIGASVVLGGTITVADASVSFSNSAAASMGTDVTIAYDGSAKGDQYAFTATGNNVLVGPTYIEIATDGGSTDAQPLFITIEFEATLNQDVA